LEQMPSADDHARFLDAARGLLAVDPNLRSLKSRARSKLVSKPIKRKSEQAAVLAELWHAVVRAAGQDNLRELHGKNETVAKMAALRVLMAYLIAKGLTRPTTDRRTLLDAAMLLLERRGDIEGLLRKDWGGRKPVRQDPATRKWVQAATKAFRERKPKASKADIARWVHTEARRRGKGKCKWRNPEHLRTWMYKQGIEI
jgi:hypothetical protein